MVSSLYIVIASMVITSSVVNGQNQIKDAISTGGHAHMQDSLVVGFNLNSAGDDSEGAQQFDIYDLAYVLIIWGCIGLLTLANMVIAIYESIR